MNNKLIFLIPVLVLCSCYKQAKPKETLLRRYEYYNTESKLIKATDYDYFDDDKIKLETEYEHTSKKDELYISETRNFSYSENKETTLTTSFDDSGAIYSMSKIETTYDSNNKILEEKESSSDDEGKTWKADSDVSYSYKYDSNNNITSIVANEAIRNEILGVEYAYDEQNREILQQYYQVIDDTKIYSEKTLHEYKKEENYFTISISNFYLEDDEEKPYYQEIYYYDNNDFNYKLISYEDGELCSTNNFSMDGNVVVETSLTYSSSSKSYHTSQIKTLVYDKDVIHKDALLLKEIIINPSSSTGHNKKAVRNYKYDEWGHLIEQEYKSYIFSGDYERLSMSYKEVWIYK